MIRQRPGFLRAAARSSQTFRRFPRLSGLGLRYYSPGFGRWLSRDPIANQPFRLARLALTDESLPDALEETESVLQGATGPGHSFCANDPVSGFDALGLQVCGAKVFRACWWDCMKSYPYIVAAVALSPAGLLNLKTPFDMRQPGASWWTSIDRRLGFPTGGRGAFVRIVGSRAKYAGYAGTVAAAASAFGIGYMAGASAVCTGQCLAE